MNAPFNQLYVQVDAHGYRHVHWSLDTQYQYPQNCVLRLEYNRAGGNKDQHTIDGQVIVDGQWILLSDQLQDVCQYIDYQHRNFNTITNDYYRLVLKDGQDTYTSSAVHAGDVGSKHDNAKLRNMVRLAQKQIKLNGRAGVLLKKKQWGPRCPKCTDLQGDQSVNQHCPICAGTGIVGGYYKGIPMGILQQGTQNMQAIAQDGFVQNQIMSVKMVAHPWIHLGDVWVDSTTNQRYYIKTAAIVSRFRSVPLMLTATMQLLQKTDAIYSQQINNKLSQQNSTQFIKENTQWDRWQ